jgi:predicted ester cyclase
MKTNEELFSIFILEGFGKGDTGVFDRYASPGFIEHQHGFSPPNAEGVKKFIVSLHQAFPDFSMTIEDLVADGDKVWGRMTARGTHKGRFGPIPATHKQIGITIIDVMRFEKGLLVEHWGVADRLSLMEQLGMKPPPKFIMSLMKLLSRRPR